MGLLDALLSNDQGGGLLSGLPSSWQWQNPNLPPQFAPLSPIAQKMQAMAGGNQPLTGGVPQAPPPAPAPQPGPINTMNIGGYQMPQFGTAADYTPQQTIPAAARPAQGQMPLQETPEQLPPALGGGQIGGNFGAGLQSLVNTPGGILPKLLGGASALLTGQRTDPQGMQMQNLQSQYYAVRQTLQQSGLSPQEASSKALLAVMNPEAGKTILQEALTNKEKYGVISEDPLAGKKYGFINEREQTVNGQPLNAQGATTGGMDALQKAQDAGVSGEALYNYRPKAIAPVVKAMIEGRQPLPSTTAMRSPATLALIDAAHAVDPQFDATVWKARNEAGPDWTKGKSSEMVRAANQTLAHVGSLMNAMDDMHNTSVPAANWVKNNFNEQVSGAGEPGAFRTNAHAVAEEMSKVFKGANLSDSEIRHWEQNLSENMSPAQMHAQIAKLSELLHGSLDALEEKRLTAMGPAMAAKQGPLIKQEGQQVLNRIDQWLQGKAGASSAVPKPGAYEWTPDKGLQPK